MKEALISFLNNIIKYINKKVLWAVFLFSIMIVILGVLNINFVDKNLINFESINQAVKSSIFMIALLTGSYFIVDFSSKEFEKINNRNFDKRLRESQLREFLSYESSVNELKFLKKLFENNLKEFFIDDDFKELFIEESALIYTDARAGLNQYVNDNIYTLKNRKYLKSSYKNCKQIHIITDFCWSKLKIMKKNGVI